MKKIFFDTMGCSCDLEIVKDENGHFVRLSVNGKDTARFDIMLVWDMIKEYLARLAVPSGIERRAVEAVAALREGNDYASRH